VKMSTLTKVKIGGQAPPQATLGCKASVATRPGAAEGACACRVMATRHDGTSLGLLCYGAAAGLKGFSVGRGMVTVGLVLSIANTGVGALPSTKLGDMQLRPCDNTLRCVRGMGAFCSRKGGECGCVLEYNRPGGVAGGLHERPAGFWGSLRGGSAESARENGVPSLEKKDGAAVRRFDIGGRVPSIQGIQRRYQKKKKGKSFAVREVLSFLEPPHVFPNRRTRPDNPVRCRGSGPVSRMSSQLWQRWSKRQAH